MAVGKGVGPGQQLTAGGDSGFCPPVHPVFGGAFIGPGDIIPAEGIIIFGKGDLRRCCYRMDNNEYSEMRDLASTRIPICANHTRKA